MTTYYWRGGSDTWNGTNQAPWGVISGGPGGFGPPTAGDDVVFNIDSHTTNYTVTTAAGSACRDITTTAPLTGNLTLAGTGIASCAGSINFYALMVRTLNTITFTATSTGKTLTWGNVNTPTSLSFNGSGGEWIFQDDLNTGTSRTIGVSAGAVRFNGKIVSSVRFDIGPTAPVIFDCTNSTLNVLCTTAARMNWPAVGAANWTLISTGGKINIDLGVSAQVRMPWTNAQGTWHTFTAIVSGSTYGGCQLGGNITVTNVLTITGVNAHDGRVYLTTNLHESPRTITLNAGCVYTLTNCDLEDILFAGGVSFPLTGTSIGNGQGCSNVTFTTPVTRYLRGGGGNICGTALWSDSSGGAGGFSFPLIQDTIVVDGNSFSGAGQTLTFNVFQCRLPSIDFTNAPNSPTIALMAGTGGWYVYGSVNYTGTGGLTGTSTCAFKGRGAYTFNAGGRTILGSLELRAQGGTLTLASIFTSSSGISVFSGTYTSNNLDFSCTSFILQADSNPGTCVINFGTSVVSLTGTGTIFGSANTNPAAVTLNISSSTLKITNTSATARAIVLGGGTGAAGPFTFGTIWYSGVGTGTFTFSNPTGASHSVTEIKIDTPPKTLIFQALRTLNVTTFNVNGTAGNLFTLQSTSSGTAAILNKVGGGLVLTDYGSWKDITGNPSNDNFVWYAGDHGVNVSGNTRINFRSLVAYNEGVSESVNVTEALSAVMAMALALTEGTNLTESLSAQMGATAGLAENPGLTENLAAQASASLGLSESVAITEQLIEQLSAIVGLAEEPLLNESLSVAMASIVGVSEGVVVTEQLVAQMAAAVGLSENVTLLEFLRAIVKRISPLTNPKDIFQTSGPGELRQTSGPGELFQTSGPGEIKED